ncbi:MAG: hypothetical protein II685_04635 [Clostridia bacterium]|nr:hypothetical protein [Clostridia bacterium]
MELTITLANRFQMTPFEILKQDCDEVIDIVNHIIEKSEENKPITPKQDNFWDF